MVFVQASQKLRKCAIFTSLMIHLHILTPRLGFPCEQRCDLLLFVARRARCRCAPLATLLATEGFGGDERRDDRYYSSTAAVDVIMYVRPYTKLPFPRNESGRISCNNVCSLVHGIGMWTAT